MSCDIVLEASRAFEESGIILVEKRNLFLIPRPPHSFYHVYQMDAVHVLRSTQADGQTFISFTRQIL